MPSTSSDFMFELMANFGLPVRNLFLPPGRLLEEVPVAPGSRILDFGCGPGAFTFLLAEKAGGTGRVYALDIHPRALAKIERKAHNGGYQNIHTILSDCSTSLPDMDIDLVVLFDVFHLLGNPREVLYELHRVLTPRGMLAFSDHHMQEKEILTRITENGLFQMMKRGRNTYQFVKAKATIFSQSASAPAKDTPG
jgi:ubiquinone/menaquinone biosynthesis C-methylase UbiE